MKEMGSRHERDHVIDDARTDAHRRANVYHRHANITRSIPGGWALLA
jgi:hypothetical protein